MKNINKLSNEELLNALEKAPENTPPISDVVKFLLSWNLNKGEYRITNRKLYELYTYWTQKSVGKHNFFVEFNKLITSQKDKGGIYYLLNITPEEINEFLNEKRAPKTDKTKSKAFKEHFETFLNHYEIKPGYFGVNLAVLLDIYFTWFDGSFKTKKNRLTTNTLREFLKLYFTYKVDKQTQYFLLDPRIINRMNNKQKLKCLSSKAQKNALKKEEQTKSS